MTSSSSSYSSSAPAKSSQPLHHFELPPLLKWNSKDGTHKRHRSMKSPSPSLAVPASSPPPRETKEPAIDDEFERLSLLQEEALRHYRGRDWWSELDKSDVIAYRRNHPKKSASPARIGRSGEFDVYRRNPLKKSSFAPSPSKLGFSSNSNHKRPAGDYDFCRRKSAFSASPASFFDSGEGQKYKLDAYHRSPPRLEKSAFASPKKQKQKQIADTYPKNPLLKKSAFASSPKKHTFSSNSEDKPKIQKKNYPSNPKNYGHSSQMKQPINSEDKSSKVAEGDHETPKKKSAFASPTKKLQQQAFSSLSEEKKSKAVEADSSNPKEPLNKSSFASSSTEKKSESKKDEENPKETDLNDDGDGDEEIKVWNLRPRVVKNNSKNKAQQQLRSGGATKSAVGSDKNDKEKEKEKEKEKKKEKENEKLSIAISLTKQEIEEDIFALTGAKPSRRPKKRPKNVQKQLDSVFPGLWLMSITPESYKVSENSLKG